MPDLPYRAIDPLMGTPLRSPNAAASRSLEQRLKDQGQRSTPQGTFRTGVDGRLEFVPKMAADAAAHAAGVPQPTHSQQVLEHMRSIKCEPTADMLARRAQEEARAMPAEGDDEREAMTNGPAFDPYSEPLSLGDTVQGTDGRIGRVTLIEPQRLGVVFERGGGWCGDMGCRGSLRLLAKTGTWGCDDSCPF